jgi:hypothetical protein
MALTFQSSYMPDGMIDFLAMVRGCALPIAQYQYPPTGRAS